MKRKFPSIHETKIDQNELKTKFFLKIRLGLRNKNYFGVMYKIKIETKLDPDENEKMKQR